METEDLIRDQMEDTRTNLTDKLQTLEQKVAGSISETTSNVVHKVEAVKDTLEQTFNTVKETVSKGVDTVKEVLDIPGHVERHPWAMFGGAVAAGFGAGFVVTSGYRALFAHSPSADRNGHGHDTGGWLSHFAPEFSRLKSLALGALIGAVRKNIVEAAPPEVGATLDEFFAKLTDKIAPDSHPAST